MGRGLLCGVMMYLFYLQPFFNFKVIFYFIESVLFTKVPFFTTSVDWLFVSICGLTVNQGKFKGL